MKSLLSLSTFFSLSLWLLLIGAFSASESSAQTGFDMSKPPYFCHQDLGKLPIQQGGRVKPLDVHSREVVKYLTGKTSAEGYSATVLYCLLSLEGLDLAAGFKLTHKIEHVKVKELLGDKDVSYIPYDELVTKVDVLRLERQRLTVDDGYKKAVSKALNQAMLYQEIKSGQNWTLPLMNGPDAAWIPLTSFLTEDRVLKQNSNSNAPNPFHGALFEAKTLYEQHHGTKHDIEYMFARARLPTVSLIICLLALAGLTLFKRFTLALVLSSLTVILQTVYFIFRTYISERAPVTNMYETVVFSGYSAMILAMVLGHFKKEKVYLYMGLGYNVMCLMMTNFAHGMLSPGISPLVPVLRDNFWLSTHVTVVIMSYGAYALSWILANTVLFKKRFGTLSNRDELYYSDIIYTCIKWGSVLIAAGIILGGVWADYSWGRFWGWDPKETWSLIVFCLYIAILHGRYTNWIPTHRFVMFSAAAFMSVMMCWFGVNYILASGLHSYGFSEGGAVFLGSFFFIQVVFIFITIPFMKSDSSQTPDTQSV